MPNREAPYRIVPCPIVDDGSGYHHIAVCPLCLEHMDHGTVIWWPMPTDPPGLHRCVHALCAHEFAMFELALQPML